MTARLYLAKEARRQGCGRMEWVCLDWNTPSIEFYKSLGARPMDQWTINRPTLESRELPHRYIIIGISS